MVPRTRQNLIRLVARWAAAACREVAMFGCGEQRVETTRVDLTVLLVATRLAHLCISNRGVQQRSGNIGQGLAQLARGGRQFQHLRAPDCICCRPRDHFTQGCDGR